MEKDRRATKGVRDPIEVRKLEEAGIVRIGRDGIRVIDGSRILDLPVMRSRSEDPRRQVGKKNLNRKAVEKVETKLKPSEPKPTTEAPPTKEKKVILPQDLRKKEILKENFVRKELTMSDKDIPKGVGLDVGTSFLVAGRFEKDGNIHFNKIRDCFLVLEPKSPVNKKFLQKGLEDRKAPYIEKDGKFYVLGEEAFLMANERHLVTRRPMSRGVLSPQETDALPILTELLKRLLGPPRSTNERLVFSVPGKPIDAEFDQIFHQDMVKSILAGLGYAPTPMNEAEALGYSELVEDALTGIAISCGSGMMNVAVLSAGDPVLTFSTTKSGDWIDQQAAIATNTTATIVQQEKESPDLDLISPDPSNHIHQAIAIYYGNLIVYTLEQIAYDLSRSPSLPKFKDPIPLVVGGGTSMPRGFLQKFEQALSAVTLPIQISQIRHAENPLFAVANGLTLAATMED